MTNALMYVYLYSSDDSVTGYILGDPNAQQKLGKERNLSKSSCGVLRALMNACLTWAACATVTYKRDYWFIVMSLYIIQL